MSTGLLLAAGLAAWAPDVSRFPADPAVLPARLELMRPGQVRDAVARGATCLLPVAAPGTGTAAHEPALWALAGEQQAVLAPTIAYGPTAESAAMSGAAYAGYLSEVLRSLAAVGFRRVEVVELPPAGAPPAALSDAVAFALADLFNNLWQDPRYGLNWWARPDREKLPPVAFGRRSLEPSAAAGGGPERSRHLTAMNPTQVREAARQGLPCFVPVGVVENHGNQCPIGCDVFEVLDPLLRAAAQVPVVVAPPIWYGPTGYAVTGPGLATTDVNATAFARYASGVVAQLAEWGFRRVVFYALHQGPDGAQQSALRLATSDWARPRRGDAAATRFEVLMPVGGQYDHAGRNETSWMLYLHPEQTNLSLVREGDYRFCWEPGNESKLATAERGREFCERVVRNLVQTITERTVK